MHRVEASLSPQQRSKSVFPPRTRLHNQTPAKGEPGSDGDDDDNHGDGDSDDHNDDDDDDHNDDDDIYIYIMVKCLSVCHKSHYFRIQGIWPFLLFLDTFPFSKVDRKKF